MTDMRRAVACLHSLRKLPQGWNYGDGGPISAASFVLGHSLLLHLNAIAASRLDVLPGGDSGATFLCEKNGETAEIHVTPHGVFDLYIDKANGETLEYSNLDFGSLTNALEDAGWRSLKSSGSRTRVFTVASTDGSPVRHSPTMVVARLLSQRHASKRQAIRSATISAGTMPVSAGSRQSFSDLPQRNLMLAQG